MSHERHISFKSLVLTQSGFLLAIISGAVTSGLGYVMWYIALKELVTSTAAIVQLSVPSIASIGGVLFLGEVISIQLIVSSTLILGGIYVKMAAQKYGAT